MVDVTSRPAGSAAGPSLPTPFRADDTLVFERRGSRFRLVGGTGRGESWADIVEIAPDEEPLVVRALRTALPVRVASDVPERVVGPYWAPHAILIPVGTDHLVAFGQAGPITASDATCIRAAAAAIADTEGVPAEKLLADELELVHALRELMAYQPQNVADTARHIATVAARALSCDVAAVGINRDPAAFEEVGDGIDRDAGTDGQTQAFLRRAAERREPLLEQVTEGVDGPWASDVVARLTVPIGSEALGALAVGHGRARPRGFTLQCQRIGRALAESAELLLRQAIAREELAAERDLLRRATLLDPLTSVGNRKAWDDAAAAIEQVAYDDRPRFAVVSIDLDGLKAVNDRFGHPSGDTVLRAAANALLFVLREGDTIARVGGDEFLVLLVDADGQAAARIARRIDRAARSWRVTEHALVPEMSIGWAVDDGATVEAAVRRADARMYLAKRRRTPDSRDS
jgi:diguanylate cyclase (GGDEF)-like protein